jgi:hypothetical protein
METVHFEDKCLGMPNAEWRTKAKKVQSIKDRLNQRMADYCPGVCSVAGIARHNVDKQQQANNSIH